jgi:HEAT repeat protein/PBS lyase HEAT-like repeat-containing protein
MANIAPANKKAPTADQKAEKIRDQVLALDVKRVADWVQTLVRTIKAHRMYLSNNPTLHKFQADLEARTWSVLKEVGDLTLTVQQFDFLFENYSVYHNAAKEDSLAFRFHSDGVREITLREGLEPQELRGFVEVLKRATDVATGQDDVVTLLWERDFRHIDYSYIPLEDLIEDGQVPSDYAPEEPREEGAGIPWPGAVAVDEPPPTEKEAAEAETEGVPVNRSDDWTPLARATGAWDESVGAQMTYGEAEARAVAGAVGAEDARPLQDEVLEIVAAILAAEEEPGGFHDSAAAFQRFIELALEDGDVSRANQLLARLRGIAARKAESRAEFREIAEEVIREIGRPSFLAQIAPTLNAHPEIDPSVLIDFLVQLGPSAAPSICDLLGQVNHMKFRRALCEALSVSCKDDVEVLIARLNDSRWYVIRNVVYVLGRIAHQGVERALDRALHHEDVRVRKEAVRALGNIESPTSRALLVSAFRDPDAGVRSQAAMTLAMRRDDRAAQSILGAVQAPEFARRDETERRAFFEALGRCGSDSLVPKLETMLTRGGLFRSGNDEERFHAALALAWLGTPAAVAILQRELEGKREAVRRAVEAALQAVRATAQDGAVEGAPGGEFREEEKT